MKNNITQLEIQNFKSIKDLKIDCKRINVFIGEPNVGKSNILEALSLYITQMGDYDLPIFKEYVRYEKLSNLFYDQDRKNNINVKSNIGEVLFRYHMNSTNSYDVIIGGNQTFLNIIKEKETISECTNYFNYYFTDSKGQIIRDIVKPFYYSFYADNSESTKFDLTRNPVIDLNYNSPVKRYIFKSLTNHNSHFPLFLKPPYGDNLFAILESNPKLFEEVSRFFLYYGLDLLIDTEANKLDVQKKVGNRTYKIPFSLAADTLQRIIFHIAAIETNDDSILLLEEPEAHSFPPYISLLAEKIVESKNNQFFIATHSPYILTPFIEQASREDVAIFVCKYENYETKVRALSSEEIANIMETDIDLFFNIPAFQK